MNKYNEALKRADKAVGASIRDVTAAYSKCYTAIHSVVSAEYAVRDSAPCAARSAAYARFGSSTEIRFQVNLVLELL